MSHTISLSLRPDPASFRRDGREVKGRGLREGSNCMVVTMFLFCFFLKPQMTHISLWKDKPSVKGRWRCLGPCERSGGITYQGSGTKEGGLPLFISPSGVQGGVTQCDGCSPDPQTPADTFNGHRFLSRQKGKREGGGWWRLEWRWQRGVDFERLEMRRTKRELKWKVKTGMKVRKELEKGWGSSSVLERNSSKPPTPGCLLGFSITPRFNGHI